MRRRVVITGIGPVSPIGQSSEGFWSGLRENRCGLGPVGAFDASGFPCDIAGEIKDLNVREHVPKAYRKATKVMARDIEIATVAARLAVLDAGLTTRDAEATAGGFQIDGARVGCQIGAGLIAAETDELARALASSAEDGAWNLADWGTVNDGKSGMDNLPPLWLLKYLPNMLACHVTIIHGLEGPSNTITCSESSALLSIGEGARVIERNDADMCLSGGAESKVNPMGMLRFDLAKRMAHVPQGTAPETIIRPFDPASKGGVMGEGGGILVIEEREHAVARDAKVYCEVVGFGAALTPPPIFPGLFDPERPEPIEPGERRAIENALRDASMGPDEIDAVIPLGLGVPSYDAAERGTLESIFGDRLGSMSMMTITERVGDCIAGHGGLALSAGAMAIREGVWPSGRDAGAPRAVLVCTHAVGGQNAAVVLRKAD